MYHVSAQGVDERMINVHYYYYYERYSHGPDHCMKAQIRSKRLACDPRKEPTEHGGHSWCLRSRDSNTDEH